nr:hypothetical protein CFP56_01481 [Quercus suber]
MMADQQDSASAPAPTIDTYTPDSNHASRSVSSPQRRSSSTSPSVSPSRALDAVPRLDRSTSTPTNSTSSTTSNRSRQSRLSDGATTVVRRRGYMRPQGTSFADSARNRDSVMSLGSIAHMQYYFARTGLLDGKGAQLAKERDPMRKRSMMGLNGKENTEPVVSGAMADELAMASLCLYDDHSSYAVSEPGMDHSVHDSPTEIHELAQRWGQGSEPPMLPPTVSTYKQKPSYTEPLPDMSVLRRELKEALQDACKVLEESQKDIKKDTEENDGFYEVQGLHLLDIITLAIRAAKNYYTAHTQPHRLYAIRSERTIRGDLYQVLDILKRMASRNFRGGIRLLELTEIIIWIESIDKLIKKEEEQEQQEAAERESWAWREGDWTGREHEREWVFLKAFDADQPPLPRCPEALPAEERQYPNDFLLALQDGQRLVKLHNALVARSKRKFDEIKTWHVDVAKPYRMAENLRFWIKAAELRWEIKLTVPVSDLVNNKDAAAWKAFEAAVLTWATGVREELTEEWRQEALQTEGKRKPPELRVEVSDGEVEGQKVDSGVPADLKGGPHPVVDEDGSYTNVVLT